MGHIAYESLGQIEDLFRALADRTRLRMARLLYIGGEATVGELMDALQLPQYSVSRHLSILRQAGIVRDRRDGTWRYYSVTSNLSGLAEKVLFLLGNDLSSELLDKDLALFKDRIALRVDGKCVIGPSANAVPNNL